MLTLYWPGFPALMNRLTRGDKLVEREAPKAAPETPTQRELRWADEAAAVPSSRARWGNFR